MFHLGFQTVPHNIINFSKVSLSASSRSLHIYPAELDVELYPLVISGSIKKYGFQKLLTSKGQTKREKGRKQEEKRGEKKGG